MVNVLQNKILFTIHATFDDNLYTIEDILLGDLNVFTAVVYLNANILDQS